MNVNFLDWHNNYKKGCEILSKQSNQRYRKEVLKNKQDSIKTGLEKSNFQSSVSKDSLRQSSNVSDEK